MDELDPELAQQELWYRAELVWKLREYQVALYDDVWRFLSGDYASRKLFLDCHRRYGKSFVLFLIAVEACLGKSKVWPRERRVVRFAAPTMVDLEEIYIPIAEDVFADCPDELRPVWQSTRGRGHFVFPSTGGRLYLFGVNAKHYQKARGKKCHLAVVDEAAACEPTCDKGIDGVVRSIIMPQTLSVNGRIVMATTPPESPAHDSHTLKAEAQAAGTYLRRTLDQTAPYFGANVVEEYARESGGRDSTAFRREYLCEWVVDAARAIVPEFDDERAAKIVKAVPAPTFETPLVSLDVGFEDFSHVLYGYYDFRRATLCIQAEDRIRRMRTDQLAAIVKTREAALWPRAGLPMLTFGGSILAPKPLRVSDVDLILLKDMSELHGLDFMPTSKDELEAMVNQLRLFVQTLRIQIDPSCEHLIRQLKSAIWNKARTAFERTSTDGHFDGVASLIYMGRNAPVHMNPYPAFDPSITSATHHITAQATQPQADAALRAMFAPRRRA